METCCVCGRSLPNRWAVARRETVGGVEKCYCALHAGGGKKTENETAGPSRERTAMKEPETPGRDTTETTPRDRELARKAGAEAAAKAWAACSSLAGKAAGGLKALWEKVHPDRSPAAMIDSLDRTLAANRARLADIKPQLEKAYADIVAKKALWQKAPEARRRLLKTELETLLARYKGLEREFGVLNENTRTAEAVRGRYLEVLAYEMRGKLGEDQVDDLSGLVDEKAEEADGVQDALRDLEKAGRRKERDGGGFEDELAGFDGALDLSDPMESAGPDAPDSAREAARPDDGLSLDGFEPPEGEA